MGKWLHALSAIRSCRSLVPTYHNLHSAPSMFGASLPSTLDGRASCVAPWLPVSQHPIGLAGKHPEPLVSGFKMHEAAEGKGSEPLPLPPAQEGNPGVSEFLCLHAGLR